MNDDIEINKEYWTYVFLVTSCPHKYLNKKGKILHKLVEEKGQCASITRLAKKTESSLSRTSLLCNDLNFDNHIKLIIDGNKKMIRFNDEVLQEGLKIANKLLGNNEK